MMWSNGNPDRHVRRLDEPLTKWFDKDLKITGKFINRLDNFQDLQGLLTFSGASVVWDWSYPRVRGTRPLKLSTDRDDHFRE